MNFLLILTALTWHVARGLNYIEPQLLNSDRQAMKRAAEAVCENQLRFSLELYKASAIYEDESFALSTAAAFVSLSQLYYGSNGTSRRQLRNVLNYSPDSCMAGRALQDLVYRINRLGSAGIAMNSTIFHAYPGGFEDSFTKEMGIVLNSQPQWVTSWGVLANGSAISQWARDFGILNPFPYPLSEDESLFLASASKFQTDFDVDEFAICHFRSVFYGTQHNTRNEFVKIFNVFNYGEINYRRDLNDRDATAQYIIIPTIASQSRDHTVTIIILPSGKNNIAELEKYIDEEMIKEMLVNKFKHSLTVILPRYLVICSCCELTDPLMDMELTEIFKETRDFEKIVNNRPTKVGLVLHQGLVVHGWREDDVESCDSMLENHLESVGRSTMFLANRPFMILTILNDENPIILSMGRFA